MNKKLLITGGAGFIGSAVIRHIINEHLNNIANSMKGTKYGRYLFSICNQRIKTRD